MEILIADDTKGIIDLLKDRPSLKDHKIDSVYDGKSALELIKSNRYDLAFLDYNIPNLTGSELIKYIKHNNLKAKTVMITGDPAMNYFVAKTIGADEYLAKPLTIKVIEDVISKYSQREK